MCHVSCEENSRQSFLLSVMRAFANSSQCSTNEVCDSCLKLAGDPFIAGQVCLRKKMKEIYVSVRGVFAHPLYSSFFNHEIEFHSSLDSRKRNLDPVLASLTGNPQRILLSVPYGKNVAELHLEVMRSSISPYCRWKRLGQVEGVYMTCSEVEDERYVVVPSSLPSIDELDNFGRKVLSNSDGNHSGGITRRLDDFLLHYCNQALPSRLVSNTISSRLKTADKNPSGAS